VLAPFALVICADGMSIPHRSDEKRRRPPVPASSSQIQLRQMHPAVISLTTEADKTLIQSYHGSLWLFICAMWISLLICLRIMSQMYNDVY